MNENFKRFTIYNLFFLCAFIGMFMVLGLRSFADVRYYFQRNAPSPYTSFSILDFGENKVCLYKYGYNKLDICSLNSSITVIENYTNDNGNTTRTEYNLPYESAQNGVYLFRQLSGIVNYNNFNLVETNIPIFENLTDCYDFLFGYSGEGVFDETLKLDSFKITSWQIKATQLTFHSKLEVKWSDSRIANVQVRIVGTANSPASFEGNSSPFKQKFYASNYVMKNGDVIHFTATPYKSNGEYGESLYYSITYDDGLPTNWYRKLVNTPYNDTTIDIPYHDVSGQPQSVTLPVDGVTTNKVYKVNYNPVTYEYGDINLYEIYYSPVVVYPEETPEEEIDDTQDVITNVYTTNNYNTINNNTNYDFEINFGDISNNDIQDSYNDVGNFLNGFGSFLAKVVSFFGILFPFFPTGVSIAIITAFGIIVLVLIVAFVIKIVSAIKNFIFP